VTQSDKLAKLETSYKHLLEATARLMQRTSRRHASIKDLERTVLYMRSLYNQSDREEPIHREEISAPEDDADEAFVEKWAAKRTFMVECDKERRCRKRLDKESDKRRKIKEIWDRWRHERLQILESENEARENTGAAVKASAV
jgi:hypothetical protein